MSLVLDKKTHEIIDKEDGQIIATLSDSATTEQGIALVTAYNNELSRNLDYMKVANAVLEVCQRARDKDRPFSNINIEEVIENALKKKK